jgi:four helix bundle protein
MNTNTTRSYKDLVVWQEGIALAKLVYQLTKNFPSEEKFGLLAQMRRAAVSIPSNIAEGQARHTTGEFIQFISHAEGSLAELDTQLILSIELKFCRDVGARSCFRINRRIAPHVERLAAKTRFAPLTRHSSLVTHH